MGFFSDMRNVMNSIGISSNINANGHDLGFGIADNSHVSYRDTADQALDIDLSSHSDKMFGSGFEKGFMREFGKDFEKDFVRKELREEAERKTEKGDISLENAMLDMGKDMEFAESRFHESMLYVSMLKAGKGMHDKEVLNEIERVYSMAEDNALNNHLGAGFSSEALLGHADVLLRLGRPKEALEKMEKMQGICNADEMGGQIVTADQKIAMYIHLGDSLTALGRNGEAVKAYGQVAQYVSETRNEIPYSIHCKDEKREHAERMTSLMSEFVDKNPDLYPDRIRIGGMVAVARACGGPMVLEAYDRLEKNGFDKFVSGKIADRAMDIASCLDVTMSREGKPVFSAWEVVTDKDNEPSQVYMYRLGNVQKNIAENVWQAATRSVMGIQDDNRLCLADSRYDGKGNMQVYVTMAEKANERVNQAMENGNGDSDYFKGFVDSVAVGLVSIRRAEQRASELDRSMMADKGTRLGKASKDYGMGNEPKGGKPNGASFDML